MELRCLGTDAAETADLSERLPARSPSLRIARPQARRSPSPSPRRTTCLSETAESFTVTLGSHHLHALLADSRLRTAQARTQATIAESDPITVISITGPTSVDEGDATTDIHRVAVAGRALLRHLI